MADFIVNCKKLHSNYSELKSFIHCDRMFYAVKANGNEHVLKCLNDIEAGFEISSSGELLALKEMKVPPERIISSIPVKATDFIIESYDYGIRYYVFECTEELKKLEKYAKYAKKILRIYISDIDSESCKWGMTEEQLISLKDEASGFFDRVDGVTFHVSRNYQTKLVKLIYDRVERVLSLFNSNKELIVNTGGGYRTELPKHLAYKYKLNGFYEELNKRIDRLKTQYNVKVYSEPGRGIADTACDIVINIEQAGFRNENNYAFIDLNAYELGSLPSQIYLINENREKECIYDENWFLDRMNQREKIYTTFVDTICEWKEFLRLPLCRKLKEGDVIKMVGVGAYSVALSSDFHLRKRLHSEIQ